MIPVKEIASRQKQTLSLMPDNIALGLTPQALVNLVEFLITAGGVEAVKTLNR